MQDVTIDACCLINLCAAEKILSPPTTSRKAGKKGAKRKAASVGLDLSLHVPAQVSQEALYLLQPDKENEGQVVKEELDLSVYIAAGILCPCDLEGEAETTLFVNLATQLDDGEAACLAIAESRGWWLATDDRKGIRIASEHGVDVITTPEIIKHWADDTSASDKETATVVQNIDRFACYRPRKKSPLYSWWMKFLNR